MAPLTLARSRAGVAAAARRREIERHLGGAGWSGVPRSPPPAGWLIDGESAWTLAGALTGIGPLFAAFGRYLSRRADLLDEEGCAALAEIPDVAQPAPWGEVSARIAAALDRPTEEAFGAVVETPLASRLLWQTHHAVLRGGRRVVVRVRRPGIGEAIAEDLPHLELLSSGWPNDGEELAETIADFERALDARLDGSAELAALGELRRATASGGAMEIIEPERELSCNALMTLPRLRGRRLGAEERGAPAARWRPAHEGAAYDLARRIALGWAELAFEHEWLAIEAELVATGDDALLLVGGDFTPLVSTVRDDLYDYLLATARHDPASACAALERQLVAGPRADRVELAKRVRQLVPWRGPLSTSSDGVADHLLAHWELVRRCGFRPRPPLAALYRGTCWLAATLHAVAPDAEPRRDPLAEALEDLSWRAGLRSLGRLGAPRELARVLEGYAGALSVLPQRLERALDRLERRNEESEPETPVTGNGTTVVAALGLAMAALALIAGKLALVMPAERSWIDRISALAFVGLGALLLRLAGRAGKAAKRSPKQE